MIPFYRDYVWKQGKPYGTQRVEEIPETERLYRIVADPYHKWISIEAYSGPTFDRLVYDSRLFDFRKLTPNDQMAWRREAIDASSSWLFNEDDRLILREECLYTQEVCREIRIYSPYNTLLGIYQMPEGPEGIITLYDSNAHAVMQREHNRWIKNPI